MDIRIYLKALLHVCVTSRILLSFKLHKLLIYKNSVIHSVIIDQNQIFPLFKRWMQYKTNERRASYGGPLNI